MKEIIKKIVVGVLAVAIVVGAAVYRFVIYPKNKAETTTTDVSVSDTSADSQASTTKKPKEEKTTKADTSESDSVSDETESTADSAEDEPQSEERNPSVPASPDAPSSVPAESKPDSQTPTPTKPTPNNPTPTKPTPTDEEEYIDDTPVEEGNKIDPYQQLFKSGKFLMKVNDPELGPVTMAMSGNKMYIEASMEGLDIKMIHNGSTNSGKLIEGWCIVFGKIYSPMPADMVGDMNVEELTKGFANEDDNTVYNSSVEEIVVNGEEILVDVESCVDKNGNTTKYYFNGDILIRSDSISPDGSVSTTEFSEISAEVSDSLFVFPKGSIKTDFSGLLGSLGG